VLIFVDALADPVLLAIDPALLGLGQMAAVLRHISLFAVLHVGFTLFQIGRLMRVQFSVLDAIANALLLVFLRADSLHSRADGRDRQRQGPLPKWLRFEQRRNPRA